MCIVSMNYKIKHLSWVSISLELRQAFDLFDTDSSGGISISELKQALSALGVNMSDEEARQMFSAIDIDSKNFKKESLIINSLLPSFFRKWFVIKKKGQRYSFIVY